MKQIIRLLNLRKIIFFQTNRIIHHKECLKLLFCVPAYPTMEKKRKQSEQPQEKSIMGRLMGREVWPIIYKWKNPFVSCGLEQTREKPDRGISDQSTSVGTGLAYTSESLVSSREQNLLCAFWKRIMNNQLYKETSGIWYTSPHLETWEFCTVEFLLCLGGTPKSWDFRNILSFYCEILINLTLSFLENEVDHIIGQKKNFEKLNIFEVVRRVLKQSLLSCSLDA